MKNYKRRIILSHGTRIENVIGILLEGLKISPYQSKNQGDILGRGIYLSSFFGYALNYSFISKHKENSKGYVFLVETVISNEIHKLNYKTKMNFNNKSYFISDEGYEILNTNDNNCDDKDIILIKDETDIRIKYLVEVG